MVRDILLTNTFLVSPYILTKLSLMIRQIYTLLYLNLWMLLQSDLLNYTHSGATGPSGLDALGWRRLYTSCTCKSPSLELCHSPPLVAKWLIRATVLGIWSHSLGCPVTYSVVRTVGWAEVLPGWLRHLTSDTLGGV